MKKKLSGGAILGWGLAGLTVGLLAGVLVTAAVGRSTPARVRRVVRQWRGTQAAAPNLSGTARVAREALNTSDLRHFAIEVVAVRTGVVELHGWVPTRAIRSRAARLVAGLPGIDRVVNGLLVQGEDDRGLTRDQRLTDQTA